MRPNSMMIIRDKDKILAQKGKDIVKGQIHYRLLGGGIEFGETSLVALKREIKEELGANIENEKLLKVIENIFTYNGKHGHEITFLYSGDIIDKNLIEGDKISILDTDNSFAEWVPVEDIKNKKVILYPEESVDFL